MSRLVQGVINVKEKYNIEEPVWAGDRLRIEKKRGYQALSISDEEPVLYIQEKKIKKTVACDYNLKDLV